MNIFIKRYFTWLVACVLVLLSFGIFFNTINLGFFSDDFYVMHRLTIDKIFWAPGFFRPLSDVSLLLNYKMFGYQAYGYRITNIALHACNCFLLYKTIVQFNYLQAKENQQFALIAAALFACYPFHSEAIIWIVGRASLLANTLGILALYIYSCNFGYAKKIALIGICFFLAISSYESVMVLPGLIFFLALSHNKSFSKTCIYILPLAALLVLHFIVRKLVSGVIFGNYGVDMFDAEPVNYFSRFIKSIGRLFVPGMHNTSIFLVAVAVSFLLIVLSFLVIYKKRPQYFKAYSLLWILLLICQCIPGVFGVDTHTSDGDRMLYLPSVFLCTIIAFIVVVFLRGYTTRILSTICLLTLFVLLQFKLNANWQRADAGIKQILNTVKNAGAYKQTYIANLPESIEGSFMFRNGFKEALIINNIDGQHVKVINQLSTIKAISHPLDIVPQKIDNSTFVFPQVTVENDMIVVDSSFTKSGSALYKITSNSQLFFWNKKMLLRLF